MVRQKWTDAISANPFTIYPPFTSPSFMTEGVTSKLLSMLVVIVFDDTLFLIIVLSSSPTMLTNAYIAESHFPYFQILWCVALSLGQHFLWAHALDFPWLDAWLETLDSRILSHHKWKVLSKSCWKCNVIALTKSVNVILKLLDGWLLSLIGLDVFPTSPNQPIHSGSCSLAGSSLYFCICRKKIKTKTISSSLFLFCLN